ncbi:olfactory receptor 6X1-like [Podarcis muralis]
MVNVTFVTEFILLGFPELHGLKMPFFTILLVMYLLTLTGNSLIIVIVCMEPMLHTPMYFFLVNFSMAEICTTTTVVPKMLVNAISGKTTICFACCMAQGFVVFAVGAVEFITLTVMSFDRYIAIRKPLLYKTIMTNRLCLNLTWMSWVVGFVIVFSQSVVVWTFPFCGNNVIDHFFCDVGPVLKLACADTSLMELIGLIYGAAIMWGTFGLSLISYTCIIATIIQIPSATGRSKAFVTCASHLIVITMFYLVLMVMYLRPSTHGNTQVNKAVSIVHTNFIPLLNPFIYTIRNKDFKAALQKNAKRRVLF